MIRLLTEDHCRELVDSRSALVAVRDAFIALAEGRATLPAPLELDLPDRRGEMHVKGAYLAGSSFFSFKAASGFYDNPKRGLPVSGGLFLVFRADTGFLSNIILDNGYLTDIRTGAAGALAADLLANPEVDTVSIVGAGIQARFQLLALLDVRRPRRVVVFSRSGSQSYADEIRERTGLRVDVAQSAEDAVRQGDVVVTTTPARTPYVRADWLKPGVHITAMGSDLPEKQELEPEVLSRAVKVVTDSSRQASRSGELHHAIESGILSADNVYAELGEIAAALKPGRETDEEVTVADLTGLGIQDSAIASLVAQRAEELDLGTGLQV